MSPNNHPILYAGLDVAKATLQLDLRGVSYALENTPKGHARILRLLAEAEKAAPPDTRIQVVLEATGGYEAALVAALHKAGRLVSVIPPARARHFAQAGAEHAKSDPIDAAVLTAFGEAMEPAPTPPASEAQRHLAAARPPSSLPIPFRLLAGGPPRAARRDARGRTQPRRALHREAAACAKPRAPRAAGAADRRLRESHRRADRRRGADESARRARAASPRHRSRHRRHPPGPPARAGHAERRPGRRHRRARPLRSRQRRAQRRALHPRRAHHRALRALPLRLRSGPSAWPR